MNILIVSWLFSRILEQKGMKSLLDLSCFHESETRKEWIYSSIFGYFHVFETVKL